MRLAICFILIASCLRAVPAPEAPNLDQVYGKFKPGRFIVKYERTTTDVLTYDDGTTDTLTYTVTLDDSQWTTDPSVLPKGLQVTLATGDIPSTTAMLIANPQIQAEAAKELVEGDARTLRKAMNEWRKCWKPNASSALVIGD